MRHSAMRKKAEARERPAELPTEVEKALDAAFDRIREQREAQEPGK